MNPSTVGGVLRPGSRSPGTSRHTSHDESVFPTPGSVSRNGDDDDQRHFRFGQQQFLAPLSSATGVNTAAPSGDNVRVRQRRHTGGGGGQQGKGNNNGGAGGGVDHGNGGTASPQLMPLDSNSRMYRSGSWGGVNESDEDVAAAAAVAASSSVSVRLDPRALGDGASPVLGAAATSSAPCGADAGLEDSVNSDPTDEEEEDFRRRLAFFFLDPVQKFKARGRFPWKLALQFLKIVLVTAQILIFGNYRYAHTKYFTDNKIALEHLFLKNWDSVREIDAYPPAVGAFAIYRKTTFYDYLDYIARTYDGVEEATVNPVFRDDVAGLHFCVERFDDGHVFPNLTWSIDFEHLHHRVDCIRLPDDRLANLSSATYLEQAGFPVPWDTLTSMHVNFTLRTLTYTKLGPLLGPECFTYSAHVVFDNSDYDGQIPIRLHVEPRRVVCPKPRGIPNAVSTAVRFLNYFVATTCLASFVLCLRALVRAQMLRKEAEAVFKKKFGWALSSSERLDFLNGWYIVILINDVLIFVGCLLKEMIESRHTLEDLWDFCSLFLGTGNLLVWIGTLRYLGFFKAYNVLILTMKGALPNVGRFLICGALIYFGFVFCGWIILGPYNFKFKTVLSTSECLFSLINGDDMFATFSSVPESSGVIWTFSRVYLYVFISLFIYVILSLFIAIIMDTYELIKEYYKNGFPVERMHEYYERAGYDPASGIFRNTSDSGNSSGSFIGRVFHLGGGDSASSAAAAGAAANGALPAVSDRAPLVT